MCVPYVSFGHKVRPRTFGSVVMDCVVYFKVQIVLIFHKVCSEHSTSCFFCI